MRPCCTRLQQRIERGDVRLDYDAEHGYLPSVLTAPGISPESQMLVFSRTSMQREHISPVRPRALYFNDETYVGWVRYGPVLEHQVDMHNLIARAASDTRRALRDGRIMNQLLKQAEDHISPATRRRIENAGQRLLK